MPSISSIIPAIVGVFALSELTYANPMPANSGLFKRLGCYGYSDIGFSNLHGLGYSGDIIQEVKNDIHSTCTKAAGKTIKPAEPFWLCTNWEKTGQGKTPALKCCESCQPGIDISGSNPAAIDAGVELCRSICQLENGAPDLSDDGWNHLDWAIEVRDGQEKTTDYETCKAAFETELGGCSDGSEQNHNGFWFRIDPNARKCAAQGTGLQKMCREWFRSTSHRSIMIVLAHLVEEAPHPTSLHIYAYVVIHANIVRCRSWKPKSDNKAQATILMALCAFKGDCELTNQLIRRQ